jgi:hypothetical protein
MARRIRFANGYGQAALRFPRAAAESRDNSGEYRLSGRIESQRPSGKSRSSHYQPHPNPAATCTPTVRAALAPMAADRLG